MSFPFKKCFDEKELADLGIETQYDSLGNIGFYYDGVEMAYLLDIIGEPFEFASSFRIDDDIRYMVNGEMHIVPIYKTERYWNPGERGPVMKKVYRLNWHTTALPPDEFREEFMRRIVRTVSIYRLKKKILETKFPWIVEDRKSKLSNYECIEHELVPTEGDTRLTNGNYAMVRHITTQVEKIPGHNKLEHSYWSIQVKTPITSGIMANQELFEYEDEYYIVMNDRFTDGNRVLMKLNGDEYKRLYIGEE